MKIVKPSFEILTPISKGGEDELKAIERAARTCYKSEDLISEDISSAEKLIKTLLYNGHEAMLEHSQLSVKFIVDRGVSHELVRHRLCSFAQESTRYCNYSKDKFDGEITVVEPSCFKDLSEEDKQLYINWFEYYNKYPSDYTFEKYIIWYVIWYDLCTNAEHYYFKLLDKGMTPQEARSVLPTSLKTELVVTANYREWRNIFKLRCDHHAHPDMRYIMCQVLDEVKKRIPIIFDDIK